MRKERIKVFRNFVVDLASLSKCAQYGVAALITDKDLTQVYSIGINGGAKGGDECLCVTNGKYGCVHAEVNALAKCMSDAKDKVMFTTLSPCKQCAAAIINSPGSFSTIYYIKQWKDISGLMLLQAAGIKVVSLDGIDYIDWEDK